MAHLLSLVKGFAWLAAGAPAKAASYLKEREAPPSTEPVLDSACVVKGLGWRPAGRAEPEDI